MLTTDLIGPNMTSDLPSGTKVGERYEIVRFIGKGGFANVYEAQHLHMKRAVAIKILNAGFEGPENKLFEERFLLEATAAAQIEHPNVVTIYDFGFTGEHRQPYIVMQLLRGRNLKEELLAAGPMEPRRAVAMFADCLEALGQGHRKGIIHKDLKPANLFLSMTGAGREKLSLVDFGVARIETADVSRLTSTGQILGTPKYLAPEYLRDQAVSPALDVYQMGLILVEMLSGRAAVTSSLPYTCILAHCTGELSVPVALLESPLGPIIARASHIDVARRFTDANDLLEALLKVDLADVPWLSIGAETSLLINYKGPLAMNGERDKATVLLQPKLDLDALRGDPDARGTGYEDAPGAPFMAAVAAADLALDDEEHAAAALSNRPKVLVGLALAVILLLAVGGGLIAFATVNNSTAEPSAAPSIAAAEPSDSLQRAEADGTPLEDRTGEEDSLGDDTADDTPPAEAVPIAAPTADDGPGDVLDVDGVTETPATAAKTPVSVAKTPVPVAKTPAKRRPRPKTKPRPVTEPDVKPSPKMAPTADIKVPPKQAEKPPKKMIIAP